MISRRDFVTAASAAVLLAGSGWGEMRRALAQGKLTQADLLRFEPVGNVTLIHLTDLHAQLVPVHSREPSINIGAGAARGQAPHLTGQAFLRTFKLEAGSAAAHALTADDFAALARVYGRMGGLDRIATLVKAIRAEREGRTLLLDGGDTWTGSWTSLQTKGQDLVEAMALLQPDAMTGHWEFTLGEERVRELTGKLGLPFLAQNIRDNEFEDRVFAAHKLFERGGVRIAVIGQAFPFTPIANPHWMFPKWTFGIRDGDLRREIEAVKAAGADLVVLLSHNGFDVDCKLGAQVAGIDVILSGHTHDALPEVTRVERQVRLPPRSRRAGQSDQGLPLSADPGVLGCGHTRSAGYRGGRRAAGTLRPEACACARPDGRAPLSPRNLRRQPRRRHLRGDDRAA
jgi:S-sulfosulfanyl-L-cysteine sulfohydrolase